MARETVIRGPLRPLVDALGGVGEASRVLGIDRRTVRRWGTGETLPSALEQWALNRWAEKMCVKRPYREA